MFVRKVCPELVVKLGYLRLSSSLGRTRGCGLGTAEMRIDGLRGVSRSWRRLLLLLLLLRVRIGSEGRLGYQGSVEPGAEFISIWIWVGGERGRIAVLVVCQGHVGRGRGSFCCVFCIVDSALLEVNN